MSTVVSGISAMEIVCGNLPMGRSSANAGPATALALIRPTVMAKTIVERITEPFSDRGRLPPSYCEARPTRDRLRAVSGCGGTRSTDEERSTTHIHG